MEVFDKYNSDYLSYKYIQKYKINKDSRGKLNSMKLANLNLAKLYINTYTVNVNIIHKRLLIF